MSTILPMRVRKGLLKMGRDLSIARKKRNLTASMMAERIGVADTTYYRMEKGDPKVALGSYAMAFFVLGLGEPLSNIVDASLDDQGLLLEAERLPQRVRRPKSERPL